MLLCCLGMGQICPVLCGMVHDFLNEPCRNRPHCMGQICPIPCGESRKKSYNSKQRIMFQTGPEPSHIVWDRSVPYYVAWLKTENHVSDSVRSRPHSMGQICPILCGQCRWPEKPFRNPGIVWDRSGGQGS